MLFECACDSSVFFVLCLIASKAIWALFMAFLRSKMIEVCFLRVNCSFLFVWCSGGKTIQGWIRDWSDRAIGGLHYAGGVAHDHIGLDVMPRQSALRWWRHGTRVWGSVVKNGISDHLRQALLSASSGLALRDTEDRGRPGRGLNKRGRWCAVVGRGEDKCRVCAGGAYK